MKNINNETFLKSSVSEPITAIVLTYNGCELLKKFLHTIKRELEFYNPQSELLIVDNHSSDDTINFLSENFPESKIISNKENFGFAKGCNIGVLAAKNEYIVLLNNDMELGENFFEPLLAALVKDDKIFSVSPTIIDVHKNANESVVTARIEKGFWINHWISLEFPEKKFDNGIPILYSCGGCMAFRKKDFFDLKGFDTNFYKPYYVEDIDLSYRAWKSGKKIIYINRCSLTHYTGSTTGKDIKFKKMNYDFIIKKNMFIFFWKNITDLSLIIKHILWMPYQILRSLTLKKKDFIISFFAALLVLPEIIIWRFNNRTEHKKSDKEILDYLNSVLKCYDKKK